MPNTLPCRLVTRCDRTVFRANCIKRKKNSYAAASSAYEMRNLTWKSHVQHKATGISTREQPEMLEPQHPYSLILQVLDKC